MSNITQYKCMVCCMVIEGKEACFCTSSDSGNLKLDCLSGAVTTLMLMAGTFGVPVCLFPMRTQAAAQKSQVEISAQRFSHALSLVPSSMFNSSPRPRPGSRAMRKHEQLACGGLPSLLASQSPHLIETKASYLRLADQGYLDKPLSLVPKFWWYPMGPCAYTFLPLRCVSKFGLQVRVGYLDGFGGSRCRAV